MPVPGYRSTSSSPGRIPRIRKSHAQKARGFRPGSVPPRRAGCAESQSRTPGRNDLPGQTTTGSHVLWSPNVLELTPIGFTQAHTRARGGQSGKSSRRARALVESAHPA
jgi:hypothetical protein